MPTGNAIIYIPMVLMFTLMSKIFLSLAEHEMHGQYIFISHRIKFIEHDLQCSHPKGSIFVFEEKEVMCLCDD